MRGGKVLWDTHTHKKIQRTTFSSKTMTESSSTIKKKRRRGATARPACPHCAHADGVITKGGGTRPKYRYACRACGLSWQQLPPHLLVDDSPHTRRRRLAESVTTASRGPLACYRCGICGQRKTKGGHECAGFA